MRSIQAESANCVNSETDPFSFSKMMLTDDIFAVLNSERERHRQVLSRRSNLCQ